MIALVGGAAALSLGSFMGALAHRLPRAERLRDVLTPSRSACPACGTTLRPRDLVPILSYLWRRGRCGTCGARISPDYALLEAGTLAAFLLAFFTSPAPGFWFFFTALAALLLLIAVIDRRHLFVPDEAVIVLGGLWLLDRVAVGSLPVSTSDGLIGATVAGSLLLGLRLVFLRVRGQEALGLGDVKLAAVLGLYLGWQTLGAFLGLAALGTLAAIALSGRTLTRERRIPFAPGLGASGAILLLLLEMKALPL